MVEASNRLKQAQHFSTCRKVQMETLESIRTSLIPGERVSSIDLSDTYLHIPFHPNSRKYLTQSLGWITNREKPEVKPTQVFLFVGFEYHLGSALVKPSQERWLKLQDLILRLKSKHVLTARCLMLLIGLLASTEKMVPEGCLHMRPFQFSPQGALEISSVAGQPPPLDRNLFSTPRVMAESHKLDER